MRRILGTSASIWLAGTSALVGGCGEREPEPAATAPPAAPLIVIDGSSTVAPGLTAVVAAFRADHPEVEVDQLVSGTGGGFRRFCRGRVDVLGASRPIRSAERRECRGYAVSYFELPVAADGVAVVVHRDNDWVDHLTTDGLRRLWGADEPIRLWSELRDGFPDEPIRLFGPGRDSGTYDFFKDSILGDADMRGDYVASEDDDVLVSAVARDPSAIAYFGYSYLAENPGRLRPVPIDDANPANGDGPIGPSPEAVRDGVYQPLSRPLLVYVRETATILDDHTRAFIEFLLGDGRGVLASEGYIVLSERGYELARERLGSQTTGTAFGDVHLADGLDIETILGGLE